MKLQHQSSLCDNCFHKTDCVFKEHSIMPIQQCEEHEIKTTSEILSIKKNIQLEDTEDQDNNFYGLCKNCDLRNICTLRTEGVIVINCEEYQ